VTETAATRLTYRSPLLPLYAIGTVLAITLVSVAIVRIGGISQSFVSTAAPQVERALRFEDRPDGSIAVLDAQSRELVDTVAPGTNGFLRGALRGLARERKRRGIGEEPPFLLAARADGRLTLDDTATQRQVDLKSFGPTNAEAFQRLLLRPASPGSKASAAEATAPGVFGLQANAAAASQTH